MMRLTKLKVANVALVAVAATGGGLAYASVGSPTVRTTAASALRTATIGTGTVMTTVSSSGNVTAPNNITVNFATSGKLTELDVKVGDHVTQGQLLARVDSTSAKASLDAANAQLASAQAKLSELEQGATTLVKQGLQISEAQSQQQVVSAQTSLANAKQNLALDQAQQAASVAQAQQQLATDQATYLQDESTLGAAVTAAENQASQQYSIDSAQEVADKDQQTVDCAAVPADPTDPAYPAAKAKCDRDGVTVLSDLQKMAADGNGTPADSTAAINAVNNETATLAKDQATIDKDNTAITNAKNNQAAALAKDNQTIANAEQQLTNAQLSLQSLQNSNAQKTAPPLPSDVQSAEAAVEQAQAQADTAQQTLDAASLTAPADGTIGAINATVGQTVSAGSTGSASTSSTSSNSNAASNTSSGFITLTNLTNLQVVADIDEADSSKILVGAPATVTLNAITGKEFAAHVIEVANTATVSSNVVEYQITFSLDNTDPTIKPGMTANVSVTTAKADGVLNVTSTAVRTTGGTSYVMLVQPDGTQKQVDVVVGLKGDTTTEISGAVKAGDSVALPASTANRSSTSTTTTTNNNRTGGGFGGGGLGGGGVFIGGRG